MQRSIPEVLQDIAKNFEAIVRSEFRLAKAEFQEAASKAAKPSATFGAGLVLGIFGLLFCLLAVVYALSMVMAAWLAALIVGVALVLTSGALLSSSAKELKEINVSLDRTIRNI